MLNQIAFDVQPHEAGALAIMPRIDRRALSELIAEFESRNGMEPAGGYGGLIPEFFNYGALDRYFIGNASGDNWEGIAGVYVLGCNCGEVGCWPLVCQINAADQVTWNDFRQPHRPMRNYSNFGPFVFERVQYEVSVKDMLARLG
jgi:hypothetical protein